MMILFPALMLGLAGCGPITPLGRAAKRGDAAVVQQMLVGGEDANRGGAISSYRPLNEAVFNNASPEIVELLIKHGADVNFSGDGDAVIGGCGTPLHFAVRNNNPRLVKLLLDSGADPARLDCGKRKTPLMQARDQGAAQEIIAMLTAAENSQRGTAAAQSPESALRQVARAGLPPVPAAKITSDVDLSIPAGRPAGKYDVAVVIGNADYSATGTPDVDYALQDARSMRQYLIKSFGYDPANIIYLENASLAKMSEVFGTASDPRGKLYKWVKPGQSRIFVYYAGHGAPDQQSGDGYFVPVDANPQYITASGYKLSTFYDNLAQIPALRKTVVIDACFSGSSAKGQLLKGVSGITARLKSEPRAGQAADLLLTSADMNQVASWYPEKGHSLFTYFFLKGLQGDADANRDGHITLGEMKGYLDDEVPYMARRLTGNEQTPVIMGRESDALLEVAR